MRVAIKMFKILLECVRFTPKTNQLATKRSQKHRLCTKRLFMVNKLKAQTTKLRQKSHKSDYYEYNFKQKHLTSKRGIQFRTYQQYYEIFTILV